MKCCSFTGHREINPSHREKITPLLLRAIAYAYNEGCREFFVGGALGFDTLAAQEIIKFRMSAPDVRLHIIIPCRDQAQSWSESDRAMYEYILSSADEVSCLSESYYDGCMRDRNRVLAERCEILIAYAVRARSGAGQTVRMAKAAGKAVYNLYHKLDTGGGE